MKKSKFKFMAPLALTLILSGCGGATGNNAASSQNTGVGEALLGAIAQNVINGNQQTGNTVNNAINAGSAISGLIGQLINSATTMTSIAGTWSYAEPTIQFESENLLAKAGGAIANRAILEKVEPYYKKLGISKGALVFVFNKDNTCSYTIKGKKYEGTYAFNSKAHTLTITNALGFNILNAYATVSANEMAITFDTTKLLTFLQNTSLASASSTVSTISTISKSYSGMKTGFLFNKK